MSDYLSDKKKDKSLALLESQNIVHSILAISFPMIITGFMEGFYNTVDSIFIGRYIGESALAAVSINNIFHIFFIAIGSLFTTGVTSILSRALGAHHHKKIEETIIIGIFLCFIVSIFFSIGILAFLDFILFFIGTSKDILKYTQEYAKILLWGGFLIPINSVLFGILRAKGIVNSIMFFAILGAMSNIFFDTLFILGFHWELRGAAWATIISQLIIFILALRSINNEYKIGYRFIAIKKMSMPIVREIFSLGISNFLRMFTFAIVGISANRALMPYGNATIAAFGIINRILHLAYQPIFGSNLGIQSLIGYNYGANCFDKVSKIIVIGIGFSILLGIIPSIILLIAPEQLFLLFTSSKDILYYSETASRIIGITFFLYGLQVFSTGALLAMGHPKQAFFLSVFRPCMMVFLMNLLPVFFQTYGVWYSFPLTDIISSIASIVVILQELILLKNKERLMRKAF